MTRAVEINEAVLGPRHPTTESILMNLVVCQRVMELDSTHARAIGLLGRCYKDGLGLELCKRTALGLLEKAMKINEAVLGPHHPHMAQSLSNLAMLHKDMGNHKAARPLLTRALEIREAVLGPRHPDTAQSLNNLATLHQAMGNHKAALPLFTRALEIWEVSNM